MIFLRRESEREREGEDKRSRERKRGVVGEMKEMVRGK